MTRMLEFILILGFIVMFVLTLAFDLELEARKNLAIEANAAYYDDKTGDFTYKDMR